MLVKGCEKPCGSCTTPIGAIRLVYEHASGLFKKSDLLLDVRRYSTERSASNAMRCKEF